MLLTVIHNKLFDNNNNIENCNNYTRMNLSLNVICVTVSKGNFVIRN